MPKIDKERFQRVLERAIEIDADRDEHLSERDVYAAGRELGLSHESVQEAIAQVEAEEGVPPPEHPRPFDTKVSLQHAGSELRLSVPARGMTRELLGVAAFCTLWFTFALCWTIGAAMAAGWAALWGLPFCAIGMGMTSRWMRSAWQVDDLRIAGGRAELRSTLGPFRWRRELQAKHLRAAWKAERTTGSGKARHTEPAHLVLEHGTQSLKLMAGRSEAELRWVNEELGRWLIGSGAKSRG